MSDRILTCAAMSYPVSAGLRFVPAFAFAMALLMATQSSAGGGITIQSYQTQTLYDAERPVYLLSAGMLGETNAAPLLVAVDEDGTVYRLQRDASEWSVLPLPVTVEPMPLGMFARPTISVGDVLPEFAGDEVVVQSGQAVEVLIQTSPGQWEKQIAADFGKFIGSTWGARIGEIDTARPGLEIFHIFEGVLDFSSGYVSHPYELGEWITDEVYHAEVGMDAAIGEINPASPGNVIVIATEMGPTYEITPQPGQPGPWPRRTLWNDFDNSGWRVLIADVLPERAGNEIVYGTRYNNRILLSYETGSGHEMEVLFTGEATSPQPSMWDVAVGNVDPTSATPEIVGVDSTGRAYLVQHDGSAWRGQTIWQDPEGGLVAVVVADVLPERAGDEIIVAGESGKITLILRDIAIAGDLNGDGDVDEQDRTILCAALGASQGDPHYLEAADFDENGVIDELDQQAFNALLPPCAGDVVASDTFAPPTDGVTDAADLAYLLGAWGAQPSCADFVTSKLFAPPPDGTVDGADLAYLLGSWGECG